jgi:hypothetical protein
MGPVSYPPPRGLQTSSPVAPRDRSLSNCALLRALAAEPTWVFSKEELLRDVWGFRSMGRERREGIQEAGVPPGEKETALT